MSAVPHRQVTITLYAEDQATLDAEVSNVLAFVKEGASVLAEVKWHAEAVAIDPEEWTG